MTDIDLLNMTDVDRLNFEAFTTEDGTGIGWTLVDLETRTTLARARGYKLDPGGRYSGPSFDAETRAMERFFSDPVVRALLIRCLEREGL